MDTNELQICFGIVFVLIGVFQVAALRWEWYVNIPKYRRFESLVGENGAKLLATAFGAAIVVFGILVAIGIIEPSG